MLSSFALQGTHIERAEVSLKKILFQNPIEQNENREANSPMAAFMTRHS
jgi:hypothetical protein